MAHTFNLWNLYQYDTYIEFDVTTSSRHRIHHGTTEWIAHCLQEFELEVPIASWDVIPGRSYYYSDYPEDVNWQDRWTRTWKVVVKINGANQPNKQELFFEPKGTDFLDPTSDETIQDDQSVNRAFIIVDYRLKKKELKKRREQFSEAVSALTGSKDINVAVREFNKDIYQMSYELLRSELFNERLQDLDTVIKAIRSSGGMPNWRERLQWLSDPKPSQKPQGFDDWAKQLNISQPSSDDTTPS